MKIISQLSALFLLLPAFGAVVVGANGIRSQAVSSSRKLQMHCLQCETMPIVFHIFNKTDGSNAAATLWNDTQIDMEVENLNKQWSETPFKFELRKITRTTNEAYATGNAGDSNFMYPLVGEFRLGDKDTVNIFVQDGGAVCGQGGFAHESMAAIEMFPVDKFSREDYVVVCGMSTFQMNENILTHEIGHWMGLQHTFEGNTCDPGHSGDGIDDTPQQSKDSAMECTPGQDSCLDAAGVDAFANFMDYSGCTNQKFTPGQIDRMYSNYKTFRTRTCAPDEAKIGLDFMFDSNADENKLWLLTWGLSPPQGFAMLQLNEGISYSNQRALSSLCVPKHKMHELELKDSGNNGFQSPSYFAYSLNGREGFRGSEFNAPNQRVFISGDREVCGDGQGRFFLELELDVVPEQIYWEIQNEAGMVIIDHKATTVVDFPVYQPDFRFGTVLFDICLDAGDYTFSMDKQNGKGLLSGYYKEYVNGINVYTNIAGNQFGGTTGPKEVNTFTVVPPVIPTPSPPEASPAPTSAPGPGFCFSGSSTIDVLDQGNVPLTDAKLGDKVHVGNGIYEPIYSFGHFAPQEVGEFLEIRTDKNILQVTNDHMVFHADSGPLAAKHLQAGDELLDGQGDKLIIRSIKSMSATGAFAPFTASGKVVVDGILASSFIAFDNGAYLSAAGMQFSYQWIAHSFEFPHRFICTYVSRCDTETYTAEGVSTWVDAPHQLTLWMFEQSAFWQALLSALAVALFAVFNVLDVCLLQHPIAFGVGAVLSLMSLSRRTKRA